MKCIIQVGHGFEIREIPVVDGRVQYVGKPKEKLVCGSNDQVMLDLAYARLAGTEADIAKAMDALIKRGR